MPNHHWGTGIGLHFSSDSEYYEVLGYLTKGHGIKIYTHENQRSGAWGYQGKLEYTSLHANMPSALLTAFNASGDARLSISPYVENLINNHNFILPGGSDYTKYIHPLSYNDVKRTVPTTYHADFDRGYTL